MVSMARPSRRLHPLSVPALLALALAFAPAACGRSRDPRAALDRFFSTAQRQDYGATYDCYDDAYRQKVSREEFVRHRREASPLQDWRLVSLEQHGDTASAEVALVFGPWPRAGRTTPASKTVHEDLVRERGAWRIRVW